MTAMPNENGSSLPKDRIKDCSEKWDASLRHIEGYKDEAAQAIGLGQSARTAEAMIRETEAEIELLKEEIRTLAPEYLREVLQLFVQKNLNPVLLYDVCEYQAVMACFKSYGGPHRYGGGDSPFPHRCTLNLTPDLKALLKKIGLDFDAEIEARVAKLTALLQPPNDVTLSSDNNIWEAPGKFSL